MIIINDDVVKGATLFGVGLTMLAFTYLIEGFFGKYVLLFGGCVYILFAVLAFIPAVKKKELIRK